ncbi:hypothetical protein COT44_03145 [Candidatus Shapirobacteria bacterium CG08_land_8_20_14_0_20_39_18]|uniref:Uncharacterized protein n=1 Tax=Candidatus Shapirobacteria bacterium CG08_land_8_20_14_0_20_39_18 TaxID=1974883 RepID=A0A2M6XCM7_9BACT|nr:MAG: hypothetical protein COT44_03145 [Candidatus Shapirobacteria bacterium CG08_land_8_20_14_0_20_39_18]PIY66511.1 MAG: hypothetical protein COY91_00260 [Candidatus Shapirobacteria bacterium CG_4_10_14_0_8_um_filter_39_15]PJE68332.1 MAG: hypothetical protein COU94_02375 [Candidatus Shapirobacteria bacterium CG10_big_fil_rev_8_21_14_0_10_38_8]
MKRRRNYLPTLLLTIIFWLLFGYIVLFTAPASSLLIFLFYLTLTLSLSLTLSLLLANSRRGFLLAFGLVVFLFFKQVDLLNVLNILLVLAIIISVEIYSSKR